jgi:hypothetical protein
MVALFLGCRRCDPVLARLTSPSRHRLMAVYDPHLFDDRPTCFLDDSSLDSTSDDHAVLGGVAFNPSGLEAFDEHWTSLMHRFGVELPFHMRDLSDGQRLSHIRGCRRWCLLTEVTAAIKLFNLYTVAVCANNREHARLFRSRLQKAMRVYRMAFLGVVVANAKAAAAVKYSGRIAYVLDKGTNHADQVVASHTTLQSEDQYRIGALTFERDSFSTHLQAADVVAWTRRRIAAGKPLVGAFEVLSQLFDDNHTEGHLTPEMWLEMDTRLFPYLNESGWVGRPPAEASKTEEQPDKEPRFALGPLTPLQSRQGPGLYGF